MCDFVVPSVVVGEVLVDCLVIVSVASSAWLIGPCSLGEIVIDNVHTYFVVLADVRCVTVEYVVSECVTCVWMGSLATAPDGDLVIFDVAPLNNAPVNAFGCSATGVTCYFEC